MMAIVFVLLKCYWPSERLSANAWVDSPCGLNGLRSASRRHHDDVTFRYVCHCERDAGARRAVTTPAGRYPPAKQTVIRNQDAIEQRGVDSAANPATLVYEPSRASTSWTSATFVQGLSKGLFPRNHADMITRFTMILIKVRPCINLGHGCPLPIDDTDFIWACYWRLLGGATTYLMIPPNCVSNIVGDQQSAAPIDCQTDRPSARESFASRNSVTHLRRALAFPPLNGTKTTLYPLRGVDSSFVFGRRTPRRGSFQEGSVLCTWRPMAPVGAQRVVRAIAVATNRALRYDPGVQV